MLYQKKVIITNYDINIFIRQNKYIIDCKLHNERMEGKNFIIMNTSAQKKI